MPPLHTCVLRRAVVHAGGLQRPGGRETFTRRQQRRGFFSPKRPKTIDFSQFSEICGAAAHDGSVSFPWDIKPIRLERGQNWLETEV